MKIDFLILAPGVEFGMLDAHPTWPTARGLKEAGRSAALLTTHEGPAPCDEAPYFRLDYAARAARGERGPEDIARRYGIGDTREFSYCEYRYGLAGLRPKSNEALAAEVPLAFEQIEEFFDRHDIGCVVNTCMGGEILRRAVGRVAAARQVPALWHASVLYFPGRVLFGIDELGTLPARPPVRFAELSEAEQSGVRAVMEWYRTARPVRTSPYRRRTFRLLAKEFITRGKFLNPLRVKKGLQRARVFFEYELGRRRFRAPAWDNPFIYFPLHWPDESDMLVGKPQYEDQAALCRNIARALPPGMELWVKPHVGNPQEGTPLALIRGLAEDGRIRIVPPDVSTWNILERARAVITVFGTTGFQALLMGVPVLALGRPPYSGWGMTRDVQDLSELPGALREVLGWRKTEEELLNFMASLWRIHIEGDWGRPPFDRAVLARGIMEMRGRLAGGRA